MFDSFICAYQINSYFSTAVPRGITMRYRVNYITAIYIIIMNTDVVSEIKNKKPSCRYRVGRPYRPRKKSNFPEWLPC